MTLQQLSQNLYCFQDTCNVYVVRNGNEALLVDFGAGDVLDALSSIGVERVTGVLMTHHHRDQGQGLARAVQGGSPIWAPHVEQELFSNVEAHWQARELYNNYNMRQDRFSILESVPLAGTLRDYSTFEFGPYTFTIVPTPGHTIGSITLLGEVDGQRVAFTGDLIAGPGKVWSLAATQWSYNGAEGVATSISSLLDLMDRRPDLLLPSHGDPMPQPAAAMELLAKRLRKLLLARNENPRLFSLRGEPYQYLTPHLLFNRTSMANSYVLVSQSGKALLFDYGYDFHTGDAAGYDRASRRPWLYTIPTLKSRYGVRQVDVVVPTHFHDDHVAGLNLLRDVEGAQVWAAQNFADPLRCPADYNLPCLWYDPITVDRVLPLEQPIQWEEYTLTLYPQPGHTLYAVVIAFEVDGRKVLVIGDQHQDGSGWNYVYANRFQIGDYQRSAELYRALDPDLILHGHWEPTWVTPEYLNTLAERGTLLDEIHRDLLPLDEVNFDAEGVGVRIYPYQAEATGGEVLQFTVEVRNPLRHRAEATLKVITPEGWQMEQPTIHFTLEPHATERLVFNATPPKNPVRRARVAVDLTVGDHHFGQQAEALVTIT
jgi:glyoxylase-like metal-dependent hydrolase (beta-lactamase superfamily II)